MAFTQALLKIEGLKEIISTPGPNEKVTEVFAKFEPGYKEFIMKVRVGRKTIAEILRDMP